MVLKFFDVVLKFEPPNAGVLNFPKNLALVLIRLVLINGDCVYLDYEKITWVLCTEPQKKEHTTIKKFSLLP